MGLAPAAAAESLSTLVRSSSGYICWTHLVFAHLGSSIASLIRCHLKCDKVLALTTLARAAPTALFHQLQLWLPRLQHRLLLSGAVRRLNKTTLPHLPLSLLLPLCHPHFVNVASFPDAAYSFSFMQLRFAFAFHFHTFHNFIFVFSALFSYLQYFF